MRLSLCFILLGAALLPAVAASSGPSRVVSADGAVTEIVYAIGAEDVLVGVDTTSRYPGQVAQLPKVGYLRALPFEGVLALRPDLLLTTEEAAPERNLERLARAGVKVVRLPAARTPDQAVNRIVAVGEALDHGPAARELAGELSRRIEIMTRKRADSHRPRVLFLLAAGNHGVMMAGRDTAGDALLAALSADNALPGVSGYKPVSREAILASRPDAIVIAETVTGRFNAEDWPGLTALEAWKNGHYAVADSMLLLGFGPRLPDALAIVAGALPPTEQVAGNDP